MTLYSSIFRRLTADGTIGGLLGTQVFNGLGLVGNLPQIQVDIDNQMDDSIDGGAHNYTVDVRSVTATAETRDTLAGAVKSSLDRQSWTDSGVAVSSVLLTGESSNSQSIDGDPARLYYVADQTFNFIAQES